MTDKLKIQNIILDEFNKFITGRIRIEQEHYGAYGISKGFSTMG